MKIALITPHYYPAVRGNAVTVRRIVKYLALRGCEVRVYSSDAMSAEDIFSGIRQDAPELIHAIHGYTGGKIARLAAKGSGIPYIITLTGTDVYEALEDSRKMEVHVALRDAAALVAFHQSVKKKVADRFPTMEAKTTVIPQGVELPGEDCSGLGGFPFPAGKFTFLLPAGLRPVKNVLFPLAPLAELYETEPRLRFILAGPVLDARYAAEVMGQLERYPFAHYLGGIGHDAIGCLFRKSDAVLNTSLFEGGMANSVLEALAFGKPVLAHDIEGNRSLIKEGVTGFLYRSEDDFRGKAERLLADAGLRQRLGEAGRRFVLENFPPEKEAEAYIRLYEAVKGER